MILVSAIYSDGPSSVIGGRGRDISFYYSSLRNISNLNVPFVLYCDPANAERYRDILSNIFSNLYVFEFKLTDFIYFNQFIEWKKTILNQIDLNDRNETLCFSKMFFLKDIISKKIFNEDEMYYWIDSGLTHHGIIPERVGGVELLVKHPDTVYYPQNSNNIFNPTLTEKLKKHLPEDKLFFCGHTTVYSVDERLLQLTSSIFTGETKHPQYHIIGGIFGGKKEFIERFFIKYNELLKLSIDNKIHLLEENLFTVLYPYFEEDTFLEKFSNWWFYSPGERNSFLTQDTNSFYKIFTKIYEQ